MLTRTDDYLEATRKTIFGEGLLAPLAIFGIAMPIAPFRRSILNGDLPRLLCSRWWMQRSRLTGQWHRRTGCLACKVRRNLAVRLLLQGPRAGWRDCSLRLSDQPWH